MTDFSKTNIHCSSISNIISDGQGMTPKQKWEKSVEFLNYWQEKYDAIDVSKRHLKTSLKAVERIEFHKKNTALLEIFKDNEPLSTGAMSHLKKVYGYAKYGKWSASVDKGTKYTNKGTLAEQASIDLICRLAEMRLSKNEIRVQNEYLTGIPDLFYGESIYQAEYIIDVKTSWDIETFLDVLGKPLDTGYWWQIQGYMALTGAKLGEVSYCLVNTPESILNHEKYKLKNRMDSVTEEAPEFKEAANKLVNNMTFDDMPETDRRLRFIVERDDAAIEKVYRKVIECRKYLTEIEQLHQQGTFLAKEPVEEVENEEICMGNSEN